MKINTETNNALLEKALKKHCWNNLESLEEILKTSINLSINPKVISMLQHIANSYATTLGLLEDQNKNLGELSANLDPINKLETTEFMSDTLEEPLASIEQPDSEFLNAPFNAQQVTLEPQSVSSGEAFEYYAEFDDPIGEALTDEDLYQNI